MKQFNHFLMMVIALMTACSLIDGSGDDEKESKRGCRLAIMSFISSWDDGDGYTGSSQQTSTINYDGNIIDNILTSATGQDCYLGECDTFSEEIQMVFSYTDNKVTGMMMYIDGTLFSDGSNLTFVDGRLTKVTEIWEGDLDEYRYMYDGDGRLIKEENWDNYSGPVAGELAMFAYTDYVYSGVNMASSKTYYDDNESGRVATKKSRKTNSRIKPFSNARPDALVVVSESTYTYDDQKNPFSGNFAIYFGMDIPASFAFSENNVISETSTHYWGDTPDTGTMVFNYIYNDKDYPSQLAAVGSSDQTTVDFTYDCD